MRLSSAMEIHHYRKTTASIWGNRLLMSNMGEYQIEENQDRMIWQPYVEKNVLRNAHLFERKGSPFYRTVSKLVLHLKDRWCNIKWNWYDKVQCHEKQGSTWEERLSSLQGGEWAGAESQIEITQRMRRMTTRQKKEIKHKVWKV